MAAADQLLGRPYPDVVPGRGYNCDLVLGARLTTSPPARTTQNPELEQHPHG